MFEKRPKFSFFLLGMFFGALCGGILVYYNSVITNENKISVNLIPQIVKQVIGVINNKTEQENDSLDSIATATENIDLASDAEQLTETGVAENANETNTNNTDSVAADSTQPNENTESITVKKEELLASKEVAIIPLENAVTSKHNKNDSLLALVSGTKEEIKKGTTPKILVELWKNPINYKGYQASKNKIIVYGFSEMENLKLYSYKNDLVLKYNETAYYIVYGNEFSSYEKVQDASLLNQINKLNP